MLNNLISGNPTSENEMLAFGRGGLDEAKTAGMDEGPTEREVE